MRYFVTLEVFAGKGEGKAAPPEDLEEAITASFEEFLPGDVFIEVDDDETCYSIDVLKSEVRPA